MTDTKPASKVAADKTALEAPTTAVDPTADNHIITIDGKQHLLSIKDKVISFFKLDSFGAAVEKVWEKNFGNDLK